MKKILFSGALFLLLLINGKAQPRNEMASLPAHVSNHLPNQLPTMQNSPAEVVKTFLTAAQQGDHDQVRALLHPRVVWYQPGSNQFSGTRKSVEEVFQMLGGMAAFSQHSFALTEVKTLATHDNSVACLLHFKASTPVQVLNVDNVDVYTVSEGKIVEVKVYSADIEKEDQFWGK